MSISSSRLSVDQHGEEEWIVVEAPEPEATEDKPGELVPSSDGVPLHLVRRPRPSTIVAWAPDRRIERAFNLGKQDCQAALEGPGPQARDSFPIASAIYCILYEPSGNWPRITNSPVLRGSIRCQRAAKRRDGRLSGSLDSKPEGSPLWLKLLGATCRLPREEF